MPYIGNAISALKWEIHQKINTLKISCIEHDDIKKYSSYQIESEKTPKGLMEILKNLELQFYPTCIICHDIYLWLMLTFNVTQACTTFRPIIAYND